MALVVMMMHKFYNFIQKAVSIHAVNNKMKHASRELVENEMQHE